MTVPAELREMFQASTRLVEQLGHTRLGLSGFAIARKVRLGVLDVGKGRCHSVIHEQTGFQK